MYVIDSNKLTGIIKISDSYTPDTAPVFSNIGEQYTMSFIELEDVQKFTSFKYSTS